MAEMGESVGGDKKLIGWAADVVQPAYLKQFIGELEAWFSTRWDCDDGRLG